MAKRILVVDDEEIIIRSLTKLLEKIGYEVYVAKNGQDALVMVEEEDFDLVIADIRMPGMNGVETIKEILKTIGKKGKALPPFIFITGYADQQVEKETSALKPFAYIYKPFDINKLVEKIKEALR